MEDPSTVTFYDAAGWPHDHTREYTSKKGLPPYVRSKIDEKLLAEPRKKFTAMWLYLTEHCNVTDEKLKTRVQSYMKRWRQALPERTPLS